jgi:diketogulonate reductase-like aldo/keto reductase
MQKANYVFPIVGGRKVEHLHDNIKALSIHLTDKQIEYLESVRPFDIGFPMNFVGEDPRVTGQSGPLVNSVAKVDWQRNGKPIGHD